MNQNTSKKSKNKFKLFFKIQFIISIIVSSCLIIIYNFNQKNVKESESISDIINKNIKISQVYKTEKLTTEVDGYLGKIIIDKINIEYPIFNNYEEHLLKLAPCKFYGTMLGEKTNICIAGHNYNDDRFFGRLKELNLKDEIKIVDFNNKEYLYKVFDIFETEENNVRSVIKQTKKYELTLLTCNNSNKKRRIVKAFCIE